jgi:hypothetical protein
MDVGEVLRRVVEAGAVVTARLPWSGEEIGPYPVDWLRFDGRQVAWLWTGEGARLHEFEVSGVEVDAEDSIVTIRTGGEDGVVLVVEWGWDPAARATLDAWVAALARGEASRVYPEGGWWYAGIPDDSRTPSPVGR